MKIKVAAWDMEHDGDMDSAREDIVKAGGKIVKEARTGTGEDEDFTAYFLVEVADKAEFAGKLEFCEVC